MPDFALFSYRKVVVRVVAVFIRGLQAGLRQ